MTRKIRFLVSFATLVLLAACNNGGSSYGGSPTSPPTNTNPSTNSISITGINGSNSFAPNPSSAKVGSTVQWKNSNGTTHRIVSDSGNAFDTGNIAPGASSGAIMVNQAGSYPYHCTIHPSMTGTLNVTQ